MSSRKKPQLPEGTNPLDRLSGSSKKSKKDLLGKEQLPGKGILSSNGNLSDNEDQAIPTTRVNYAFKVNEYLLEKLRDIAYWERLTMAELLDEAVGKIIDTYEKQNGGTYDQRTSKLKTGRPTK